MKNTTIQKGTVWMALGLLLLAAALGLTGHNMWEQYQADRQAQLVMAQLEEQMADGDETPLYKLVPEMEMPVITINGHDYIGFLFLPEFNLPLPVMSQWSYPNLKISPCRYEGSAYLDNMILAGHNYQRQFGVLKNLQVGSPVTFTDADGNRFYYEVVQMEVLEATAIEEMSAGEWDLTLFTCTPGGQARVTIRCNRIDK